MCAVLSKHNVHISPVGLDEADTDVLRYPVKSKNKSINKMIELVIPAGIQLSDKSMCRKSKIRPWLTLGPRLRS